MTWVLIVTLVAMNGAAAVQAVPGFSDKKQCEWAGTTWATSLPDFNVHFSCTPQGVSDAQPPR